MELANQVYKLTNSFPDTEKFGMMSQIRRSAITVPSNIAEGWGRNSSGSYVQFLRIAKGSLCELETPVLLSAQLGYLNENQLRPSLGLIEEISKMLKALADKVSGKSSN